MTNKTKAPRDIVLIVDDTAANHDVIRSFLEDIDVSCESAFDGMEAITACSAVDPSHYRLILMDINLPHMNGVQTTQKLRSMGIAVPIIAVTAARDDELKMEKADEVFDSILYKPFNSKMFFAAISPYIKNAASWRLDPNSTDNEADLLLSVDDKVCDVSRGIANMGNSIRLFTKHLNNFKKNNADLASRIAALLNNCEYNECAKLCHSIKGLAGMLGLTSLYEHSIEMQELIERVSRDDYTEEEVKQLLSTIGSDIRLVCQLPI